MLIFWSFGGKPPTVLTTSHSNGFSVFVGFTRFIVDKVIFPHHETESDVVPVSPFDFHTENMFAHYDGVEEDDDVAKEVQQIKDAKYASL